MWGLVVTVGCGHGWEMGSSKSHCLPSGVSLLMRAGLIQPRCCPHKGSGGWAVLSRDVMELVWGSDRAEGHQAVNLGGQMCLMHEERMTTSKAGGDTGSKVQRESR